MRVQVREGGFGGSACLDENVSGLFLDLLRTTVCKTPDPINGSVYPTSLP